MSLPFPPGTGDSCFSYDPTTQSPLNSITFTYNLTFSATNVVSGALTGSLDITETYERAPFSMTYAYGDPVPDQQFVLVRSACSNNINIGNSFVGDGTTASTSLIIDTTAAGSYVTTEAVPPCSDASDVDLEVGIVGAFSYPGDTYSVQLYFSITPTGSVCFDITELNAVFGGTTDPFDVTMDTLAEFLDEHDISITIPNPNPLIWTSWSAVATASFTGAS